MNDLQAPFPWFGGKSRVSSLVWERFGTVRNYVEPFFGSGAVLLGRPQPFDGPETINDKDGFVANFWRAVQTAPDKVAEFADNPVNESDLHARHIWLVNRRAEMTAHLEADPYYYDPQIAGWWVWGICCWIGSGFCSGKGPWVLDEDNKKLVHLGDSGQGVNKKLVHLGDSGRGVNKQLVHLGDSGQGVNKQRGIYEWFEALRSRLRYVRVCCGDWERICGPAPTVKQGLTGVFLDPPYAFDVGRVEDCYAVDDADVSRRVLNWAIDNGDNPLMRIALCGYEGEHILPGSWDCVPWKAAGGYGSRKGRGLDNANRERVWFSPHCLSARQGNLFSVA